MKTVLLLGAGLGLALALPPTASATSMEGPGQGSTYQQAQQGNAGPPAAARELYHTLRRAGFENIHIAPHSFMVHATNPNGNPVAMVVSPHAVEVATLNQQSDQNSGGNGPGGMAGGGNNWQGGMAGGGNSGGAWHGNRMTGGSR